MWYLRRIEGKSMEPSLKEGQIILVSQTRVFSRGDVVVVFVKGREVIKRISDQKEGKVFLEGDNKRASTDSRHYGWVIDRHVIGKVVFPNSKQRSMKKKLGS
jgi:nickel-type superoxide dismutase maturation protease